MLGRELLDLPRPRSLDKARALLDGIARPAHPPQVELRLPTTPEPPRTLGSVLSSPAHSEQRLPPQMADAAPNPPVRVELPREIPAPPPRSQSHAAAS